MEQENKETNIKATIDAVTGLVQAIPVYQDTLQPAAKEVGKSLQVVAKTVNIALAPVKALVWGYEKIEEFITTKVSEKLQNIPEENINTPPIEIAGPAIEALRYSGHDINIRELYANLLANSMDKNTVHKVHPGFVEILKNLNSDEALLLQAFIIKSDYPLIDIQGKSKEGVEFVILNRNHSQLDHIVKLNMPSLIPSYLDNLIRLGILEIPNGIVKMPQNVYEPLENDKNLAMIKSIIEFQLGKVVNFDRKLVRTTIFGQHFIENVVTNKK